MICSVKDEDAPSLTCLHDDSSSLRPTVPAKTAGCQRELRLNPTLKEDVESSQVRSSTWKANATA